MAPPPETLIDNGIYERLGERWYDADDDPVALLRAEAKLKNPWVAATIATELGEGRHRVLDIGCGAGFLSNSLAERGHRVTGIDLSEGSLDVARRRDRTGSAEYRAGDAYRLDFPDASFDVVCAMDFLEHVDDPARVVAEASRVLRPGGIFFFHTFDRNPIARLLVIKALEWFVRNTPRHLHVYELFVKPSELRDYCARAGLAVKEMRGIRPVFLCRAMLRMLVRGVVGADFRFRFSRSLKVGYLGFAKK